jgi:ABC-type Na+ transport system ATPase subunit NatA
MITTTGLRKAYGDHVVLDGIDLDVAEGTVYALLGPNGAGKTTIVHILSTLISADDGEIQVAGHDLAADPDGVRASIGLTGQFSAVDKLLTGQENLRLMADLNHLDRSDGEARATKLLERFDLVEAASKPASTYSGGMSRRLDLAMTLMGDPRLIFLDEPTTGLDPRSRRTMWGIIRDLVATASRSSSPRSTWRRPTSSRTASPCSTMAGSSPRARRTSSSGVCRAGTSDWSSQMGRSRRFPTTAACRRCASCSAGSTTSPWRSPASPSTPQTSTTSSSPSPGTTPTPATPTWGRK